MKNSAQKQILENQHAGDVHDALLDCSGGDLATAFDRAVCEIVELQARMKQLSLAVSAGFVRTNTGPLYKSRAQITPPPSDAITDDWIKTSTTGDAQ